VLVKNSGGSFGAAIGQFVQAAAGATCGPGIGFFPVADHPASLLQASQDGVDGPGLEFCLLREIQSVVERAGMVEQDAKDPEDR
jgi:hypothetical protein